MKRLALLLALVIPPLCSTPVQAVEVHVGPVHVDTVSQPTIVAYIGRSATPAELSKLRAEGYRVVVSRYRPTYATEMPWFRVYDKDGHYKGQAGGIIGLKALLKVLKLI